MYCKVQRGLTAAQIERGSLCVTEVRRAPAGRELEPAAAAAVAHRVEVKRADLSNLNLLLLLLQSHREAR